MNRRTFLLVAGAGVANAAYVGHRRQPTYDYVSTDGVSHSHAYDTRYFDLERFHITPSYIEAGEKLPARFRVRNLSSQPRTFEAMLYVRNSTTGIVHESREIRIGISSGTVADFAVAFDWRPSAGEYRVEIAEGGPKRPVHVVEPGPDTERTTPDPDPTPEGATIQ